MTRHESATDKVIGICPQGPSISPVLGILYAEVVSTHTYKNQTERVMFFLFTKHQDLWAVLQNDPELKMFHM